MNLTQAIARLEALRTKHGDIKVQADCPFCSRTFDCQIAVIAPEVVRLSEVEKPERKSEGPI